MMKRSVGFTIVELIIVLVILGVLATIAIRSFGTVQQKALCARAKKDMREIVLQIELYMQFTQQNVDGSTDGWTNLINAHHFTKIPEVAGGKPGQQYGIWGDVSTGNIIVWSPLGPGVRPDNGDPWPYDPPDAEYDKFPCHALDYQYTND